ncbi:DedA family protein [Kineococcus gypseus]|uniref:DedA family protein n=1 Tax=Kineococcus gypseus TaxID=1637102 RepID=UPI003D7D67CB
MSGLLDPEALLASAGAFGVFAVLFAETGLLVGFFLPGDSLLLTAGLLAATPAGSGAHLPLGAVLAGAAAGALLGAQTGYLIGRRAGPALLERPGHPRRSAGVQRARAVLQRYGYRRAVVLARFVPVVRTLMNPLAGTLGMPVAAFTVWQVVGGLVWSTGLVLLGHLLGSRVPGLEGYLLPLVGVFVLITLVPVLVQVLRSSRHR